MARIAGVDIPREKRLEISLTYLFGIGRTTSQKICAACDLDPNTRVRDLTDAARAAEWMHAATDARACFNAARVGQRMLDKGLPEELDYAARKSVCSVVPQLVGGVLRPVTTAC